MQIDVAFQKALEVSGLGGNRSRGIVRGFIQEFGYTAYQLKDDNGEMSCLQMFIGEIINSCCSNDKSTDNEVLANINFDDLRILYSKGLWQL